MTYPRPLYIYLKKPHRSCQPLLTTTTTISTAAHPLSDRLVMRCGSHLAWSGAPLLRVNDAIDQGHEHYRSS
nr:hypothetical protein Q903MT_gene3213 [Picea sitchensis]